MACLFWRFNDNLEGATIKWWHGRGSFIDYTNPNAVSWWHKQMDLALDIGIDGWKCDGTGTRKIAGITS